MKRWSIVVALLAIATIAALPATAGNGKGGSGANTSGGGGGGGSYIRPASWWDPALTDGSALVAAATAQPKVGNYLTFDFKSNYSDPTGGTGPWLQMQCYRAGADYEFEGQLSGVMILSESRAGFEGGWGYGVPFELSGTSWTLGPADCYAEVGHKSKSGRWATDASTSFQVTG